MTPRFELIVALVTPFDADGHPDLRALEAHLAYLLEHDVDGYLVGGTTGEGALLEEGELAVLFRTVAGAVSGRARVIAQVGRPSTAATLRLIDRARDAGADEVAVVAPYYYRLRDFELRAHYLAALAAAHDMPVYAYNIPSRTVNDLSAELVADLAKEGLAGIKDSTKSWERHEQYLEIQRSRPDGRFAVLMGSDSMTLEALRAGSRGVVSAVANAEPQLFDDLRNAHTADNGTVDAVNETLLRLRHLMKEEGSLAGCKNAVAERLARRDAAYPAALRGPLIDA